MEQKQLDDDSYFGEEFVDEPIEEVRVEAVRKPEVRKEVRRAEAKTKAENKPKAEKKTESKKIEPKYTLKPRPKMAMAAPKVTKGLLIGKAADTAPKSKDVRVGSEKSAVSEKAKTALSSSLPSSTINVPEDVPKGMLPEVSTWKAITGIALVLLLISVFTQGFNFSDNFGGGSGLSLAEAEQKTLAYVNANLLQEPFLAEVKKSEEVNDLFKITLSVAGQEVDSYLTKDGRIFFPRGFELDQVDEGAAIEKDEASSTSSEGGGVEAAAAAPDTARGALTTGTGATGEKTEKLTESAAGTISASSASSEASLTLMAKRWLFEPQYLKVKKGTKVHLTIEPANVQFTFAFPAYRINMEVREKTTLDFTAEKIGKFPFSCSSCEEWRGMKGVLEVEE